MSKRVLCLHLLGMIALLGLLLPFSAAPPALGQAATSDDTTPPGPVPSLGAMPGASPGSVELSWIAPGDDGNNGTATQYVVRYNLEPITETITATNWISSTDVPGEPVPSPAGSPESMTVTGLTGGQRYYFAIKTEDEEGNVSAISNWTWAVARLSPHAVFLPMVSKVHTELPPVIPETTVVMTDTIAQYLETLSDDGTFTFSQMTPQLEELDPGDVIVGSVSPKTPDGFLRKVESVSSLCDKVVVETEVATLEDAIETGSFQANRRLTPDQVRIADNADGVTMATSPDGLKLQFSLKDFVLYDKDMNLTTKYDQVTADGTFAVDLGADIGARIEWFEVRRFWFTISADGSADLTLKWKVETDDPLKKSWKISEVQFNPIVVWVGYVPVVVTPKATFNLDLTGNVSFAVSGGMSAHIGLTVGAAYERGHWSGIWQPRLGFEPIIPTVQGAATGQLKAGPTVELSLYGVAGPYLNASPYAELEVSAGWTPPYYAALSVALSAGIELAPGAKVEILSRRFADWSPVKADFRWVIWEHEFPFLGNRPPLTPSDPVPADDAEAVPANPLLLWTGGDADGAVTYDVYLEKNAPYPNVQVSSGQSAASYDAGMLEPNSDYFWRIVAEDPEGETAAGPVWSFRTGSSVNNVPTMPSAPAPANGSTNQSIYPQLRWEGGDPDGDSVTYDVYLAADNPTPDVLVCDDAGSAICYTGTLSKTTLYYWQVVSRDEHGRTNPGPVWSFTTGTSSNAPPDPPWIDTGIGDGPADGAVNQDLWTWLYWSCFDPNEDPITFDVYFEAEDGTPDELLCSGTAEMVCNPGPLAGNTGYYWQVVARDEEGATTAGPVWRFTTADMVLVPSGEFQMGCDACNPQEQCSADELPLHAVSLSPYAIDRTEVTNAEYAACVADEVCYPPFYIHSRTRPSYYDNPEFADYPVLWIGLNRSAQYCAWAGGSAQASTWHLPTEAQWEKAARGSAATPKYPWGFQEPDCSLANHLYWDGFGFTPCVSDTMQVGTYPGGASPYGALDMSGNVWERVSDVYASDYYSWSPYENPQGPSEGSYYVVRGGSWLDPAGEARAANRSSVYIEEWNDTLGFRCVAVGDQGCSPGPDQVSLFVAAYYGRQCVTRNVGDYPSPGAIGLPNDTISSVKVGSNVQVMLCEHDNFYGVCETFTADDPYLGDNAIGNDTVSSAKVELRPAAMPGGE